MIFGAIRLLLRKPDYGLLVAAIVISGLGTALTTVAVYAELAARNLPTPYYSVVFVLSVLPALFTSQLSGNLCRKVNLAGVMIVCELLGALFLTIPFFTLKSNTVWLLFASELLGAAIGGLLYPIHQTFVRRRCDDKEIIYVGGINTWIFAVTVIVGQGVGVVLYPVFGTMPYLLMDCMSYLAAATMIYFAYRYCRDCFSATDTEKNEKTAKVALSKIQLRAIVMLPVLAACCVPCMSILPAAGKHFADVAIFENAMSATLALLFARSLGQLCAPLCVSKKLIEKIKDSNIVILSCIIIYLGFYAIALTTPLLTIAVTVIFLAHIFSNVVYVLANYELLRLFDEKEIGRVSAKQYQLSLLTMCGASLVGGAMASVFELAVTPILGVIILMVGALVYIIQGGRTRSCNVAV